MLWLHFNEYMKSFHTEEMLTAWGLRRRLIAAQHEKEREVFLEIWKINLRIKVFFKKVGQCVLTWEDMTGGTECAVNPNACEVSSWNGNGTMQRVRLAVKRLRWSSRSQFFFSVTVWQESNKILQYLIFQSIHSGQRDRRHKEPCYMLGWIIHLQFQIYCFVFKSFLQYSLSRLVCLTFPLHLSLFFLKSIAETH